jgi:metal-responsive CopG/Arc/MetJ family transcriptional regulator
MVRRKITKGKAVTMVSVTLKLPQDWVDAIDEWVDARPTELMNRSDAIRAAIREKFVEPSSKGTAKK